MEKRGLTLIEVLVALALGAGLAYLAATSLVRGWLASKSVVEQGVAAQGLSQGLEYARQRLEARPSGLLVQADGATVVYQRWNSSPWVPLGLMRGDTAYRLPEDPGGSDGDLYLLLDPATGEAVVLTRTALRRAGGEWRLETSCASPFAGMAYLYRLHPVALALGGATGAEGARADALYLSEGNGPWRLVGAGLASFQASVRYRAGDGEVRVDPEGRLLPGGILSPYLSLGGKGFYLEDLLLGGRVGDRDLRVAAFLGHPAQAERVRALVACGSRPTAPPPPQGGTLSVQVLGLPQGAGAEVRVEGPGGFSRTLAASQDLSVPPGPTP